MKKRVNKSKILIVDRNLGYILPVVHKLSDDNISSVDIEIITDEEYFYYFFSKSKQMDVLIISDEFYNESLLKHNIKNIFVMTEQDIKTYKSDVNVTILYKYSNIKEIYNIIVGKSQESILILENEKKSTRVITVCSASGGVGKTTIALGLASCLAQQYKKVLYINASNMQTFQNRLSDSRVILSNETYERLMIPETNVYDVLKNEIRNEGFNYIPAFKAGLILLGIEEDIYCKLITEAKKDNKYDYIVVDVDDNLTNNNVEILQMSEKVMIVAKQSVYSMLATNILNANMDFSNREKYIFVCNDCRKDNRKIFVDINFFDK